MPGVGEETSSDGTRENRLDPNDNSNIEESNASNNGEIDVSIVKIKTCMGLTLLLLN